jgi:hypothetical protein
MGCDPHGEGQLQPHHDAGAAAARFTGSGATANLLLAISDGDRPGGALAYAAALARSLGAELHVVQVMPPLRPMTVSPGEHFDFVEARVEEIRGMADAKATEIYAKAYNQSLEAVAFYEFTRTIDAYKSAIADDTTLVLSTDSEFFKFLNGMDPAGDIARFKRGAERR